MFCVARRFGTLKTRIVLYHEVLIQSFNLVAPELNFWCNLQNPQFKLQDLFFLAKSYKTKQKEETPTGLYQNDQNWLVHTLCHLGTVSLTL